MADNLKTKTLSFVTIILSQLAFFPFLVDALPLFAKKYHLPCNVCHEAFPKLNDVGNTFRDNGYQMGTDMDTPLENPVTSFISFRTIPTAGYNVQTNLPTDQSNQSTVSTGTFNLTGLDIHSAGVLTRNVSYRVTLTPFLDQVVDVEAAWIRFSNLFGSSWLNLKLGKHELDLPFSEKRSLGLTAPGTDYIVYDYHPGGPSNLNKFDLGENQFGLELLGHSEESGIRYAIDLNNGSNEAGNQALGKKPNVYGRFSFKADQEHSGENIGVFADNGLWPLEYKNQGGIKFPGTGENFRRFYRVGGDLSFNFKPSASSLVSIMFQSLYGVDEGYLIQPAQRPVTSLNPCPTPPCLYNGSTGGTRDGIFTGGTVEIHWKPSLNAVLFSHYNWIFNQQQADPVLPGDYNNQMSVVLGFRYYLHQSPYALVAIHGEGSYLNSKKTNLITGEDQQMDAYLFGIDFAL